MVDCSMDARDTTRSQDLPQLVPADQETRHLARYRRRRGATTGAGSCRRTPDRMITSATVYPRAGGAATAAVRNLSTGSGAGLGWTDARSVVMGVCYPTRRRVNHARRPRCAV